MDRDTQELGQVPRPLINVNYVFQAASAVGLLIHRPNETDPYFIVQETATGGFERFETFAEVAEYVANWTKR